MGILSDFLDGLTTIDSGHSPGSDRHVVSQLRSILREQGDFAYPSGYDGINEVQRIAVHSGTVSGGTYTITPQVTGAVATSALAHSAIGTTVQTAINTAMSGVAGYVAGDLAVTGGPLTTTALTFTYSGNSVKNRNQTTLTANGASLTGGGTLGAITTITPGATARAAWALLKAFGIITSAPPEQGTALSAPTAGLGRGQFPCNLSPETVKAIIREAASDDGKVQSVLDELMAVLHL